MRPTYTPSYRDHGFVGFDRAVVVDVETTGLDPKNDRIVSVACLRGSIAEFATKGSTHLDQLNALLNPGTPIPPGATRVHGIRDSDVAGAEAFADLAAQLREFIGTLPLVGHNVSFDKAMLSAEFRRAGQKTLHRNKSYCTMKRLREHFGYTADSWRNMSLDEAASRFGLKKRAERHHDAHEDAMLTLQLAGGLYQLDNGLLPSEERSGKRVTKGPTRADPAPWRAEKQQRPLLLVAAAIVAAAAVVVVLLLL